MKYSNLHYGWPQSFYRAPPGLPGPGGLNVGGWRVGPGTAQASSVVTAIRSFTPSDVTFHTILEIRIFLLLFLFRRFAWRRILLSNDRCAKNQETQSKGTNQIESLSAITARLGG